jgi:unsaturated chondroitin disaccharide hydrolase
MNLKAVPAGQSRILTISPGFPRKPGNKVPPYPVAAYSQSVAAIHPVASFHSPFKSLFMSPVIANPPARPKSSLHVALEIFVSKTRKNLADMPTYPTTWSFAENGDYTGWPEGFFEIGNWTNGFFAGMGVLALRSTGDDAFLRLLEGIEPLFQQKLQDENAVNTMHDLGFLYSPFAVALYQHTGDARYRELALKAAQTLADRFIPKGGYFRAWGRMDEQGTDYDGLAIIDCLMNMPLLYRASEESGNPKFREMAVRHTNTTLANFVRSDDSVYHAYRFDVATGAPDRPENYCGHSVESHWARGNTWAMYGFALAYRHGGDPAHLDASLRVTRKFIECLGQDVVPVWDFRLSPGYPPLKDSSAGAIAICAIQELESLGHAEPAMIHVKNEMLAKLLSPEYFDADPSVRGVLRLGEVGDSYDANRRLYHAKNAYTSFGDYYLMQAVARELGQEITWW